ncbi:MAG: fibronectin type III domain-containing protein, partial [Chloroflexi bacterium]|nr:fibronectin type III domain-containing protein [Chloroflexota bacterium]
RVSNRPTGLPTAPTAVSVTVGKNRFTVRWQRPVSTGGSPITSYLATAWSAPSGGIALGTCTTGASTFNCRIGGLTSGTVVYVDVLSTNANRRGAASTPRFSSPA